MSAPTVEVTVLGEIKAGCVYAIGIPAGASPWDLIGPLREVQDAADARFVVFVPGVTFTDITTQALRDTTAELADARAEVERLRGVTDVLDSETKAWSVADFADIGLRPEHVTVIRREAGL